MNKATERLFFASVLTLCAIAFVVDYILWHKVGVGELALVGAVSGLCAMSMGILNQKDRVIG